MPETTPRQGLQAPVHVRRGVLLVHRQRIDLRLPYRPAIKGEPPPGAGAGCAGRPSDRRARTQSDCPPAPGTSAPTGLRVHVRGVTVPGYGRPRAEIKTGTSAADIPSVSMPQVNKGGSLYASQNNASSSTGPCSIGGLALANIQSDAQAPASLSIGLAPSHTFRQIADTPASLPTSRMLPSRLCRMSSSTSDCTPSRPCVLLIALPCAPHPPQRFLTNQQIDRAASDGRSQHCSTSTQTALGGCIVQRREGVRMQRPGAEQDASSPAPGCVFL